MPKTKHKNGKHFIFMERFNIGYMFMYTHIVGLSLVVVLAILGCQLNYPSNELQSRHAGHTCDSDVEAGRQYAFDLDLEAR